MNYYVYQVNNSFFLQVKFHHILYADCFFIYINLKKILDMYKIPDFEVEPQNLLPNFYIQSINETHKNYVGKTCIF